MFLFAIPAGTLVDILDRRRFLLAGESAITLISAVFAPARLPPPHHAREPAVLQLPDHGGSGHDGSGMAGRGARFLEVLLAYSRERRRDGAYEWHVFEDPAEPGRFVETFMTDSGSSTCATTSASPRRIVCWRAKCASSRSTGRRRQHTWSARCPAPSRP